MFQFGGFSLDIREHSLKRGERTIPLRPKSFLTLTYLVQHSGRLVSKDELLERIWDGVVVTDGTLTQCIKEIRRAIGDDPHQPAFIQTVPRIGYRFVAEVSAVPEEATDEEIVEEEEITSVRVTIQGEESGVSRTQPGIERPPILPKPSRRLPSWWMVTAVGAIVALCAVALIIFLPTGNNGAISSIVVLPFENLSRDSQEDFFADGLTDALIAEIAGIGRLRVISRTSAMHYRNSRKPLSVIAEELQVDAVVEGSVLRSGQRVRISAALIAVGGERRLWGETYELDQREMVPLLRSIARTLAREIPVELTPGEQSHLSNKASVDPDVYELYLKGRYYWARRTADGFRRGIECFERALARDPYYAPAYRGLADSYNMLGDYDLEPPEVAFPKARAAATQALAIDGSLAEAHASLAFTAMRYDWNWEEVEREYGLAITANANSSDAHHWYGLYLAMRGRFHEAKDELLRAHTLDPLALIITANRAWVHYFAREYDQSIALCKEALELDSSFMTAHIKLGWAYEEKKMYREACAEFRKVIDAEGDDPALLLILARACALQGAREEAMALVQRATARSDGRYVSAYHVAVAYAGLGEHKRALGWLEKALRERSGWLPWLKVDPKFDVLREYPRFRALLDTLRFRE